jgi:hypothetical protein
MVHSTWASKPVISRVASYVEIALFDISCFSIFGGVSSADLQCAAYLNFAGSSKSKILNGCAATHYKNCQDCLPTFLLKKKCLRREFGRDLRYLIMDKERVFCCCFYGRRRRRRRVGLWIMEKIYWQ